MIPVDPFAPADSPRHPANHPGPGAPVAVREVPWSVAHLLDDERDAKGLPADEVDRRRSEYEMLLKDFGHPAEQAAYLALEPGHEPGEDVATYPALRARSHAAEAAELAEQPQPVQEDAAPVQEDEEDELAAALRALDS